MKKNETLQKFITISLLSVLLTMLTVVCGSPLLRVLRKTYGSIAFWILGAVLTFGFWLANIQPLALFIGSVWMTLGSYNEFEQRGIGWWSSGVLSLTSGALTAFVGVFGAFKVNGIVSTAEIQSLLVGFIGEIQKLNPTVKFDAQALIQQIPSAIVIMLIVSLGVGLIFERRVFSWLNLPREKIASQLKLLEYRVPDSFIWLAMTAFLLTMVSFGGKAIAILAVNILNVSIVLYFFQGLAVLEVFLNSTKAGSFTRVLTYIMMIGQFPLVLSIIGLIDYWVEFRDRIRRFQTLKSN